MSRFKVIGPKFATLLVGQLREAIDDLPDDTKIFIACENPEFIENYLIKIDIKDAIPTVSNFSKPDEPAKVHPVLFIHTKIEAIKTGPYESLPISQLDLTDENTPTAS